MKTQVKISIRRVTYLKNILLTIFVFISFVICISACSRPNNIVSSGLVSTKWPNTPAAVSTSTPLIITATSETTNIDQNHQTCWKKLTAGDSNTHLAGSLVYYRADREERYIIDTSSLTSTSITWPTSLVAISSDNSLLANYSYTTNQGKISLEQIRILSQSQDSLFSIQDNMYLDTFDTFLDDGRLRLEVRNAQESNYKEGIGTTDEFYILSPTTGELVKQSIFLPYYWKNNSKNGNSPFFTRYSPNLKYVIYPAYYQGKHQFVLFEIEGKKIVWSGWSDGDPSNFSSYPFPQWKPDSSAVTILKLGDDSEKHKNLFNVSINGQLDQITYLEKFTSLSIQDLSFPKWSPNGRYLAFRVSRHSGDFLLILDTNSGAIINPCVSLGEWPNYPMWSPNSNQLAFAPINMLGDETKIMIIDFGSQEIYNLSDKLVSAPIQLLGWVNWDIP